MNLQIFAYLALAVLLVFLMRKTILQFIKAVLSNVYGRIVAAVGGFLLLLLIAYLTSVAAGVGR
jgi:hypothetical protein